MIKNKRGQISLMYLFLIFAIIVLFGVFLIPIKKLDVLSDKFTILKYNATKKVLEPTINSFDKQNIKWPTPGGTPYLSSDYNQEAHYG